ncbi:MAG: MarR family winged helix-turn-helix transcriptional regulator [Croceibacterium sp.]
MTDLQVDELSWGVLSNAVGPRARLLRNLLRMRAAMVSEPFGLPAGSLTVLSLVSANQGCSPSALADRSGLFKANVVSIVNELEERSLVRRVRSKQDRRYKAVSLTALGLDLMDTLNAEMATIEASIQREFEPHEMAQFTEYLDRAITALTMNSAK